MNQTMPCPPRSRAAETHLLFENIRVVGENKTQFPGLISPDALISDQQLPSSRFVVPGELGRCVLEPDGLSGPKDPRAEPLIGRGMAPAVLRDCNEI